jgi:hypothetical protein
MDHFELLSAASALNPDLPSHRSGTGEQNRFHARVAVKGEYLLDAPSFMVGWLHGSG